MGEVVAAHDLRIGRDVAIKRMHAGHRATRDRSRASCARRGSRRASSTRRSCRCTSSGSTPSGRPYFVMKRLGRRRRSPQRLAARCVGPRGRACCARSSTSASRSSSRTRAASCIAISSRRTSCSAISARSTCSTGASRESSATRTAARASPTSTGSIARGRRPARSSARRATCRPSRCRGDPVDRRADVYALGAILFEILAAVPLHPRGTGAIAQTLAQPQDSPSARKRGAPDRARARRGVLFAALDADPAKRPRARALADDVQRYLDGDRDTERRRALADERLAEARATTNCAVARSISRGRR